MLSRSGHWPPLPGRESGTVDIMVDLETDMWGLGSNPHIGITVFAATDDLDSV